MLFCKFEYYQVNSNRLIIILQKCFLNSKLQQRGQIKHQGGKTVKQYFMIMNIFPSKLLFLTAIKLLILTTFLSLHTVCIKIKMYQKWK